MLDISCFTGGIAQTNGYLLRTGAAALAVDAPEGMAAWLKAQSVAVSHLLLTHQHFDHCQDAAEIQKAGAKVLSFAPFSRDLTLEILMSFATDTPFSVPEFTVDEVLQGRSEIDAGGLTWQLAHVPGHSLDSLTFYSKPQNLLLAGDVLFAGSIGRTDFPGGSLETLLQGIRRHVLTLLDETRVLPGHGPETTVGEEREGNPYLQR